MIKKLFYILPVLLIFNLTTAQKAQRIAYIDMDYILENIPEYNQAQDELNVKVSNWKKKINALQSSIKQMKIDLSNEKALLTPDLIEERKEDIQIKQTKLNKLQETYFGPNGDLFFYRKQLVKPIQDQVYNAIQSIAVRKKYDFVLDKSSDLILLYSNSKFDISELVLNSIVKSRKLKAIQERKQQKLQSANDKAIQVRIDAKTIIKNKNKENAVSNKEDSAKKRLSERAAKKAALQKKIKQSQLKKQKIREELKKRIEEKRAKKLKEIEDQKKQLEQKVEGNN